MKRFQFDEATGELSYSAHDVNGLLAPATGRELGAIARTGIWRQHRVNRVVVDFAGAEVARKNVDALAFLKVHARADGVDVTSTAKFTPRADFGIK